VDCGESDPIVLEFDHVRGVKRGEISRLKTMVSLETLAEEIAKCDVRCANCHRRKTHRDGDHLRRYGSDALPLSNPQGLFSLREVS
jgi:hypothetical protein